MRTSVIVVHRFSRPVAPGPIPEQGWNSVPALAGVFLITGRPGEFYISSFEKRLSPLPIFKFHWLCFVVLGLIFFVQTLCWLLFFMSQLFVRHPNREEAWAVFFLI